MAREILPGVRELTPADRDALIKSLIWTFEIEGITLSRETAEQAVDASLRKPIPEL